MLATLPRLGYGPGQGLHLSLAGMKLFQFWDQQEPPPDVAGWIEGFRTGNPEFEHVLFNEATAADFIASHYGERELAAYRACAVPCMQSDYIRFCALDVFGGVYVDADNQTGRPLAELLDKAPKALMFTWGNLINTGFLMFRSPADPFVRACLRLMTDNIEKRRYRIEFTSTGPGVANAIRAIVDPASLPGILSDFDNGVSGDWGFPDLLEHARALIEPTPELAQSYRAITLMHALAAGPWIGGEQPAYKQTDRHWLNWKAPIYKDL